MSTTEGSLIKFRTSPQDHKSLWNRVTYYLWPMCRTVDFRLSQNRLLEITFYLH